MVLLVIVARALLGGASAVLAIAPPLPVAELPLRVLLLTVREATERVVPAAPLKTPPPSLAVAELSLIVLLVMIKLAAPSEAELSMPPPLKPATLPLIVQLFTVSVPLEL